METNTTTDLPGILAELESLNQRIDRIISRPGYEGDTARASMLRKLQTRRRALSAAAACYGRGR
jgi:hypothetical protein